MNELSRGPNGALPRLITVRCRGQHCDRLACSKDLGRHYLCRDEIVGERGRSDPAFYILAWRREAQGHPRLSHHHRADGPTRALGICRVGHLHRIRHIDRENLQLQTNERSRFAIGPSIICLIRETGIEPVDRVGLSLGKVPRGRRSCLCRRGLSTSIDPFRLTRRRLSGSLRRHRTPSVEH